MAILAMSSHGQDARATAWDKVGCELAAEVLRSYGRLRLRANGASMLPAVWPGDILHVRRQGVAEALPGDIVLFGREGRLVAHRVVEVRSGIRGTGHGIRDSGFRSQELGVRSQEQSPIANHQSSMLTFVTRGDSVDGADAPVSEHELLGRVTAIERGARRVDLRLTFWHRVGSFILSRSEFCTRLLLWLRKALVLSCSN